MAVTGIAHVHNKNADISIYLIGIYLIGRYSVIYLLRRDRRLT